LSHLVPEWKPVGPFEVLAMLGRFCVLDRGNGNRILSSTFNTRDAAERWIERQPKEQHA
jgi:hypothetical protein